jgi:DNA-binding CsgD family transcriptional regulator
MSDELARVVDWMDDVLDWLREPLTSMPVDRVLERLRGAFRVNVTSWCVDDGPRLIQMVIDPPDALVSEAAVLAEWHAGLHHDCHALTAWYGQTPSARPQTSARVPGRVVSPRRRVILDAPLARLGLDQQMTMYYRREGRHGQFFTVARDRLDFDDDDLLVARYVQRSLVTLDRQTRALRGRIEAEDPGPHLGLTGRELAVLQLISDGFSTRQSARRLACSPRTVEKHLQRAYRKLGVRDRVNAVRVARLARAVVEQVPARSAPLA